VHSFVWKDKSSEETEGEKGGWNRVVHNTFFFFFFFILWVCEFVRFEVAVLLIFWKAGMEQPGKLVPNATKVRPRRECQMKFKLATLFFFFFFFKRWLTSASAFVKNS